MKKLIMLLSAALLGLSVLGCTAQRGGGDAVPECGGVTDYTDASAPKEILSKSIVSFSTMFYAHDPYDPDQAGIYRFAIEADESGQPVLTVSGVYDHVLPVSQQVLEDVQAIIDRYRLVEQNGGGRVTAGLPPEWGPWMLDTVYESGEKLYFYENGAPDAAWTSAFRDLFVKLLVEAGFEDALPPREATTIQNFSFQFDQNGEYHIYCLTEQAGRACLLHQAMEPETQEVVVEELAVVTDALLEGLQAVVVANGMEALHAPESSYTLQEENGERFLDICIDYQNGRQIYCEFGPSELPDAWPEMRAALVAFLDAYIRDNPAK